jgi:PII-like signaling protein
MAGFTKPEDMATTVALLGMSGHQTLIVDFADVVENVERAMAKIEDMTADKVITTVDVEIRPRSGAARRSS